MFEKCLKSVWQVFEKCLRTGEGLFEKCSESVFLPLGTSKSFVPKGTEGGGGAGRGGAGTSGAGGGNGANRAEFHYFPRAIIARLKHA